MSRYWHFERDQFGMYVDVYPSEILDTEKNRYQVFTAVHCSGAPAEKVKWLKQYKVSPGIPKRVYSGGMAVVLRFAPPNFERLKLGPRTARLG